MNGKTLKFYAGVAAVGALADYALSQYALHQKAGTNAGNALRDHYANRGAWKIALGGAITLVMVVAFKDWWYSDKQVS